MRHRFAWRYFIGTVYPASVGTVYPASGRTIFHLATTINIPEFNVEFAVFARAVGASPTKQIVLVLDRASWYTSVHLRVSEHVHWLFFRPTRRNSSQPSTCGP